MRFTTVTVGAAVAALFFSAAAVLLTMHLPPGAAWIFAAFAALGAAALAVGDVFDSRRRERGRTR